jgi:hypothetical protein
LDWSVEKDMEKASPVFMVSLELAVAMRISEIIKTGYITDSLLNYIKSRSLDNIAHHVDDLLYGGRYCKETFNDLALAIAVMAFNSNGVEIFGKKWKAEFMNINLEITTEEAFELDCLLEFCLRINRYPKELQADKTQIILNPTIARDIHNKLIMSIEKFKEDKKNENRII